MAIRRSDFFKTEINLLINEDYQNFVVWFLESKCPKWFFESAASSSGKYHPAFVQGTGGLVRHCKAVAQMAHELARNPIFGQDPEDDVFHDCVVIAGMLHDCCKYGNTDEYKPYAFRKHEVNGADLVASAWEEFFGFPCPEEIYTPIYCHMGTWTKCANKQPETPEELIVALADYTTSRKMIDVPTIAEYWQTIDEELPFL